MESINDFCKWVGTQRKAAEILSVSESTISRLVKGEIEVSKELAEKIEVVSHGVFRKERVMWPANQPAPTQQGEAA